MKTVTKINPEDEYEKAKEMIVLASTEGFTKEHATSLDNSVDNLITVARVLMEREERRRGRKQPIKDGRKPKGRLEGTTRAESRKLPSERYPNLEVREEIVRPDQTPFCPCCNEEMTESGLFDTSEKLEVIPKIYYIEKKKRVKFSCGKCNGSMVNTPATPSIIPTSNYGDSLVIDVSISKYYDLIPIERYPVMAAREGLMNLPPQSLIGLTHHAANFFLPVYERLKKIVQSSKVALGDETPHPMLEGDERKNWYLWGFFCDYNCYFEIENTRSGDVVKNFLLNSETEFFLSDGYPGYRKAIKEVNQEFNRNIREVNCNAHAYRYFEEASIPWKEETQIFLEIYGKIFEMEMSKDDLSPSGQLDIRAAMLPLFEKMKLECLKIDPHCMPGSGLKKAVNYFLNHYDRLILCSKYIRIPLTNNLSERNLRSPVVGRKTWYGTHSIRGAKTNAVLFSIMQSCKLVGINPVKYLNWITQRIFKREEILTPHEYFISVTQ